MRLSRKVFFVTLLPNLLLSFPAHTQGSVGIGTNTPAPSAILEVSSANKGLLIPRINGNSLISSPTEGLIIYSTAIDAFEYYDGSEWIQLVPSPANFNVNMFKNSVYHKITNLGNGTNNRDAVNKRQMDDALATKVDNGGNTGSNTSIKIKVFEIRDWNFDATALFFIDHGLSSNDQIRTMDVLIRIDADLLGNGTAIGAPPNNDYISTDKFIRNGGAIEIVDDELQIRLSRGPNGGFFDNPSRDQTGGYIRGWLTITYEE